MLRIEKGDFFYWLMSRIRRASQGEILDLEQGFLVNVETARSEVFLEHTRRRGEFHKQKEAAAVHQLSLDQAKADPNDPFAFARTKTHLENGLCNLEDYNVDFRKVATDLYDLSGEVVGRKMVDVPMKVRRA